MCFDAVWDYRPDIVCPLCNLFLSEDWIPWWDRPLCPGHKLPSSPKVSRPPTLDPIYEPEHFSDQFPNFPTDNILDKFHELRYRFMVDLLLPEDLERFVRYVRLSALVRELSPMCDNADEADISHNLATREELISMLCGYRRDFSCYPHEDELLWGLQDADWPTEN